MIAFAAVFGAYWLALPWMFEAWGMSARVLALSYIVLAALLWGLKGGVLIALVNIPVVWGLLKMLGIEYIGGAIGPLLTLSIAAIVGRFTDLSCALEAQYVQSHQAEQALQAYRENLEHIVQERTTHLAQANQLLHQEVRERQRIEAALRHSEEQYRQLVENINDVIYATDAKGVITYVSPAIESQSGYQPAEIIGHVFSEYVYREDRPRFLLQCEQSLAGHPEPGEYRMVTKAGAMRWIRSSSRPAWHGGEVVGLNGSYMDITKQRVLEEQLREAQKMEAIGTLAGGIAHDFNNILAAMIGFTELAQGELSPHSSTWQSLQEVLTAGQRAKELIQQILIFSRHHEPQRQPLHLHLLVEETLRLLRAALPSTIAIRSCLTTTSGTVLANATQLQQVLMNLASNAAYAMRTTTGVLEVHLDEVDITPDHATVPPTLPPGPYLCLTVRDTGTGMPPEVMKRLFEPFFTTKGPGEGSGLGLAVTYGIVTSHGGTITVASTPGQGTTFAIYLPRIAEEPPVAGRIVEPVSAGKARILFVDDEEALTKLTREILGRLGYDVMVCTSSLAALAAFRAAPQGFDLVITDQTMPAMMGETLIQELRRMRPDLPVILCTGYNCLIDTERATTLGIDALLIKPVETALFTRTIEQVLARRQGSEC